VRLVLSIFERVRHCSLLVSAPRVDRLNTAINEFYPQLYECRNQRHCWCINNNPVLLLFSLFSGQSSRLFIITFSFVFSKCRYLYIYICIWKPTKNNQSSSFFSCCLYCFSSVSSSAVAAAHLSKQSHIGSLCPFSLSLSVDCYSIFLSLFQQICVWFIVCIYISMKKTKIIMMMMMMMMKRSQREETSGDLENPALIILLCVSMYMFFCVCVCLCMCMYANFSRTESKQNDAVVNKTLTRRVWLEKTKQNKNR
jgi:hypothetical protein